ncbi:MAG: PQQ-binding-like beta-propeller repeat protein [Phycisphaera sp.]|nr:PQQ-binding-like beta-propeller repeat protein [Phycisphaera sp.]
MGMWTTVGTRRVMTAAACLIVLIAGALRAKDTPEASGADGAAQVRFVQALGVHGGLCVQVGAADTGLASALAADGRYLVHVLDTDAKAVDAAQQRAAKLYGTISIERRDDVKHLPYTERLVNVLIIRGGQAGRIDWDEASRVLCPNGLVLADAGEVDAARLTAMGLTDIKQASDASGGKWISGRKPWPKEMDTWSHPGHGANGNTVSNDTIVGPPRRIRWVAGPWQEVSSMISEAGRNYYGGVLVRDAFNGLRLWQKGLTPTPARGGFGYRVTADSVPPVADGGLLFVYDEGELRAMDGATGEVAHAFKEAGKPKQVVAEAGVMIAVGDDAVSAFDVASGQRKWRYEAIAPRNLVYHAGRVGLITGDPRRGQKPAAVALDAETGKPLWKRDGDEWIAGVNRCVAYHDVIAYEVSTLNNDGPGNALHLLSALTGEPVLDHPYLPAQSHMRQARAMFVGEDMWVLHGGRGEGKTSEPTQVSAINFHTGVTSQTYPAGLAHCFPPVATPRFILSGEMNLTDIANGQTDANQITKAACGRDAGWIPANGLLYVAPKHCVCWPMLRGYAALAAERPNGNPATKPIGEIDFAIERGDAKAPEASEAKPADTDWPIYRGDANRSGATAAAGPAKLDTLWSVALGQSVVSEPLALDWAEDPFAKGPVTPAVVSNGLAVVARPDAHEVVAMDAATGKVRWRFRADGRVDTAPTLHNGLCLFGSKAGWVYCLRADNGAMVWRRSAAPLDERIVAYGQVESPWPVPGSVLVIDDTAYYASGRQPLADGGIFVFAVDPRSGELKWSQRLNSVPQKGFYNSSGLEFDNFDLLFKEGDGVSMSRWSFDRGNGEMSVQPWNVFAKFDTGDGQVWAPRGCWTYAPRNQQRTKTFDPMRALVAFKASSVIGCTEDRRSLYRRDFDDASLKKFVPKWITGWTGSGESNKADGEAWPSARLAKDATWKAPIADAAAKDVAKGAAVQAMVWAGDRVYVALSDGHVQIRSTADGKVVASQTVAPPLWDGLSIANGRVYLSTTDGRVLCLGDK